jgi:hypothetical protein
METITLSDGTKKKLNITKANTVYRAGIKKLSAILNVTEEQAKEIKKLVNGRLYYGRS